jgi:hypothetical protein
MLLRIAKGMILTSMQSRTTAATSRIDLLGPASPATLRPVSWLVVAIEADKLLQNFKNVVFLRHSADPQQWVGGQAWGASCREDSPEDISCFLDLERSRLPLPQVMEWLDRLLLYDPLSPLF